MIKRIEIVLLFTVVYIGCFFVGSGVAASEGKVTLRQRPLPSGSVANIEGFVGQRIRANADNYLKKFDIDKFVGMMESANHRQWWWIGEQPGKWLESAVLASQALEDERLEEQVKTVLKRIVGAQKSDGYLGITPANMRTEEKPLRGMDPYEQYFTFHGLLTAYEVLDEPAALKAAKQLGDYYLKTINDNNAEFWPSPYRPPDNKNKIICPQYTWVPEGTPETPKLYVRSEIAGHTAHYGWEGSLVIDPMMRLYQHTGDDRYLNWVQWVVSRLDDWSGWDAFSRLDLVARGTLGVHQLQPYVHSHTFHMNFLGMLRLYLVTGDESLLRKVVGAWDDIHQRQIYITGGVSVGEHYEPGYRRPLTGHVVETCANMSWLQLNQALLELTGQSRYADTVEQLLINHLFAAQTIDGDCNRYHTPPNGFKPDDYFHGPDCCTGSGHRQISLLSGVLYAQADNTIIINQFVPSRASFAINGMQVMIETKTRYPEQEHSRWTVRLKEPATFDVQIRLPDWCRNPKLTINGKPLADLAPGSYAHLRRSWKPGDYIELTLPMNLRWVRHRHWSVENEGDAPWTLMRGPVVYALDTVWWDQSRTGLAIPEIVQRELGLRREVRPKPLPAGDRALGPFYEIGVRHVNGKETTAVMAPFCNIGRWYREAEDKPDRKSRAFSYAVWMPDAGSDVFAGYVEDYKKMMAPFQDAVDFVLIGSRTSEWAHQLKGHGSNTGQFKGKNFRDVKNGWFSYRLEVMPDKPNHLCCTYWGGEKNKREFDILVDDRIIASETLYQNKPDEFFAVTYPIPREYTRGKKHIIVTFRAHPGSMAGGLFGLKISKP